MFLSIPPLPLTGFFAAPWTLLIVFLLLASPLFSWRRLSGRTGRKYHAIRGNVIQQMLNFRRLYDYHTEISRRSQSFRILTSPFHSEVYTSDPAVIEHILASNFQNYGKGRYNYDVLSGLVGDSLFAVDGEKWRQQRKLASYEFSMRSLRECSTVILKKNSVKLSKIIAHASEFKEEIDLQELLIKSMMDSISEVTMGVELDSVQGKDPKSQEFAAAMEESSEIINGRYINPTWKIKRFLNVGSEALLKKNLAILDEFLFELIQSRIQEVQSKKVEKLDILSRFITERERDPESISIRYLRDIIIGFILAGKDSSAAALSWFFYLLCKNPDVEKKVLNEIREVLGFHGDASFDEIAAKIDEESMKKMMYLHAALSETLRLYPVIPMNGKVCFSDDILPDGCHIKAGEFIVYQPYCMGRMESLWGDDAEIFKPERWLDANGNFCPESPFKFPAFQAGPRICLGKDFAYRQMKIYAALLLLCFRFTLKDIKTVNYMMTISLFMEPGLNVYVYRR